MAPTRPGAVALLTSGNVLDIVEGGSTYVLNLDPGRNYAGTKFVLTSDGSGGVDVANIPDPISVTVSSGNLDPGRNHAFTGERLTPSTLGPSQFMADIPPSGPANSWRRFRSTKKSSNVKVALSPATVAPNLNTFTVVGWTSLSRKIKTPYDLVSTQRADNATIKKRAAKAVWLEICNRAFKGEDVGKCDKSDD
jgi:hypothetical protein